MISVCHYCREDRNTYVTPVGRGLKARVCEECDAPRQALLKEEQLQHLEELVYICYEGDKLILYPINDEAEELIGANGLSFKAFVSA